MLSNVNLNYLHHLKVPRGAHLELSCEIDLCFPNHNLENLSRLEDWCYTHRKITGVRERILTDIGPAASVRVKWVQHMP